MAILKVYSYLEHSNRAARGENAAQHRLAGDELNRRFGEFRIPRRSHLKAGSLGGGAGEKG